jgi:DNA-3-methyladenine glycosylase
MERLDQRFFQRDVLDVAPDLIGQYLVYRLNGEKKKYEITEVEAYRGTEDLACHASKGRTKRTEIMFAHGGYIYVYLIYGMYWMLNFVTGPENQPQAALIRGVDSIPGPGRLTKKLGIDKSFYGESLITSDRLWVEPGYKKPSFETTPRIGIDYSGEIWKDKPWRFIKK